MVMTMRREVAARKKVTILTGHPANDFMREGERITGVVATDGTRHRADLVVLADGRQSRLRAKLGLEPSTRLLSYTIAFGVEGTDLPWGPRGHVFLGGPGPILAYPYGSGKIRFCIDVPLNSAKGKPAIVAYIASNYAAHVPSPLREAMLATLHAFDFEGCANHSIQTPACAAPGVVMVGDAGGCAHPLTASGMTNGLNDVLTLAEVVGASGPTDAALNAYQRHRYDFVRMRELFTDALYEVFRGSDAGSKALQSGVFRYWQGSAKRRTASMNILSGEDVRPSAFVTEYSRVFGTSALNVLSGIVENPALRTRATVLRSLTKTSLGRLEIAVNKTARTMVGRYRLGLHQVPRVERSPMP
jgi:2-polyprenyl-6-methoxyphenol hydroxylase-like FAD-dependent oxidoreductase